MFPILQDTNEACPHFCYFISVSWWKLFSEFFPDGFCNTTNWSLLSLILQWQEYRILLLCHSVLYVFIFLYLWHLSWFMAISFHGITFENKTFASRLWHFNVFLLPLHVSLRHLSCKIGNSCYVTFAIEKNLTSIIFRSLVASRPAKCHFQSVLLYWPWTCLVPSFFFFVLYALDSFLANGISLKCLRQVNLLTDDFLEPQAFPWPRLLPTP